MNSEVRLMSMEARQKLPQNIHALIGEIGEKLVLLRLAVLCHQTAGWSVFQNIGEAGFAILLLNTVTNERRSIEVKTRQKLYTTGKNRQQVMFQMTVGEYQACDVLLACFLDTQTIYVIPKDELRQASGGQRWRFVVTTNSQGLPHPRFKQFESAWHLIHPDFAGKPVALDGDADDELEEPVG